MSGIQISIGKAKVPPVFFILVGMIVGYFALKYLPHYITNYQVRQAFFNVAKKSFHQDEFSLREDLNRQLGSINPPFSVQNVEISREDNHLVIEIIYYVEIWHPYVDKVHRLYFHPRAEVRGGIF